ncbi:dihydrodipicolinate synthase family protein [candidate division KSB1 bacterium]|nr:dihydrodipicolinate synthase family protein [candidate division KSB1 bacterium]
MSQYAEMVGADGVVHTIPDMIRPKDSETIGDVIISYFETLNNEVSKPIFIYQPPIIVPEYRITPEIFAELADMKNVVAAKVSTNDAEYILSLIQATKNKEFAYIAGSETSYYAALYAGARAVVGQGSSINPQILNVVRERFKNGDLAGAIGAQVSVNYLCETCRNPVDFLKRYADEQGFPMGRAYRKSGDDIYIQYPEPLTDEEYIIYRKIFEKEMLKYV